jgi:hypothetical protein
MNRIVVAKKLAKVARLLLADEEAPYAVITVGRRRVEFRIGSPNKQHITGSEPYLNSPMKAIERVFNLVRSHKVDEADVEIITK